MASRDVEISAVTYLCILSELVSLAPCAHVQTGSQASLYGGRGNSSECFWVMKIFAEPCTPLSLGLCISYCSHAVTKAPEGRQGLFCTLCKSDSIVHRGRKGTARRQDGHGGRKVTGAGSFVNGRASGGRECWLSPLAPFPSAPALGIGLPTLRVSLSTHLTHCRNSLTDRSVFYAILDPVKLRISVNCVNRPEIPSWARKSSGVIPRGSFL